jgi:acetyl-CoA carboxylase carboxyltransferase component
MERENMLEMLKDIEQQRSLYQMGGGPKAIEKQHKRGKLTARERVNLLFDPGTFQELNLWATPFRTGFDDTDAKFSPSDAIVTGYGKVNGRTVMAYAHDFTVLTGTQSGGMHAKMVRVIEAAVKMGVPCVALSDSAGVRLQDGQGEPGFKPPADGIGLGGTGSFMWSPPYASGVIPQIVLMLGPMFAGSSYSPIMMDFLVMNEHTSSTVLASPMAIKAVTGQDTTIAELGSPKVHSEITGICDKVTQSDEESIEYCKSLLSYWPSNWREKPPIIDIGDSPYRKEEELLDIVPFDLSKGYDMRKIISLVADGGAFVESKDVFAPSVITGFARIGGQSVGIVASNPAVNLGALDMDTSDKEARFIRFCDAFNIPLVFLADTIGFLSDTNKQAMGLERHAAKVMYAISEATVPKITIYIRNCSNYGDLAFGNEQLGCDIAFAWPTCQLGKITDFAQFYTKGLDMDKMKAAVEKYNTIYNAANRLMFSDIIDPRDTRATIFKALTWLENKKEDRPWKKHGNIPL